MAEHSHGRSGEAVQRASRSAVGGGMEASDAEPSMYPGGRSIDCFRRGPRRRTRASVRPRGDQSDYASPPAFRLVGRAARHASVTRRATSYESDSQLVSPRLASIPVRAPSPQRDSTWNGAIVVEPTRGRCEHRGAGLTHRSSGPAGHRIRISIPVHGEVRFGLCQQHGFRRFPKGSSVVPDPYRPPPAAPPSPRR